MFRQIGVFDVSVQSDDQLTSGRSSSERENLGIFWAAAAGAFEDETVDMDQFRASGQFQVVEESEWPRNVGARLHRGGRLSQYLLARPNHRFQLEGEELVATDGSLWKWRAMKMVVVNVSEGRRSECILDQSGGRPLVQYETGASGVCRFPTVWDPLDTYFV